MRYTPEEVAELLKDKPHQPHYIAAMVRKAIEADREERVMEWQPIETAPKDGVFVQLYDDRYKHGPMSYLMAQYQHGLWWGARTSSGKAIVWNDATHWRPLPAPPQAEGGE